MNIVHLVVVKNSFLHFGIWKNHSKSAHFSLNLGTKTLANFGTQQPTDDSQICNFSSVKMTRIPWSPNHRGPKPTDIQTLDADVYCVKPQFLPTTLLLLQCLAIGSNYQSQPTADLVLVWSTTPNVLLVERNIP